MTDQKPLSPLATMSTGYFGLVMATGIVSLALRMLGFDGAARALFHFNIAAYALLFLLYLLRLLRHHRQFLGDFGEHAKAPGYFTAVAGTAILGTQFLQLWPTPAATGIAFALGGLALLFWLGLTYTIFPLLTVRAEKPRLEEGLNGTWLLAVVGTQSLSVLASQLAGHENIGRGLELDFFALVMWLAGGMLYIWTIALIFYRYLFFPIKPAELTPPYWINMGAMAISTLAGTFLIENPGGVPLLDQLAPFVKGVTILFWATASWWIPILLMLGVWRYIGQHFPFRYNPQYWAVVFPLGMYAACTFRLGKALELPFLLPVVQLFLVAAVCAWVAALYGMGKSVTGILRRAAGR